MNKVLGMALLVGVVLEAGCNSNPSAVIVTPNSVIVVDNADAVAWEGGFLWAVAMPIDPTVTVDVTAVAASGARTITASFAPAGCASATANGNAITLQLNDCSGPFGINHVTGTVTFAFAAVTGGVQIVASATNLQIGGGNLTISATGVLSGTGGARTLTVNTNGGGTGPNGTSVARQGQYTITWNVGDVCAEVSGTVTAGSGNVQSTSFRSFDACATGCPRSGTVTLTDPATGTTLTTTYNGSTSVTVTSSNGQQSTATITCS